MAVGISGEVVSFSVASSVSVGSVEGPHRLMHWILAGWHVTQGSSREVY
jgi:hypothetical protein